MRFDAQYVLNQLDTMGAFTFEADDGQRIISFLYEQDLGIPDDRHTAATALFTEVAVEARREK